MLTACDPPYILWLFNNTFVFTIRENRPKEDKASYTKEVSGNVVAKIKPPRKPTPYNLYHESRYEELLALGNTEEETYKTCTRDYTEMPDEKKIKWIHQTEEKTTSYIVSHLFCKS